MKFDRDHLIRKWIQQGLTERFGLVAGIIGNRRQTHPVFAAFFVTFYFYRRALIIVFLVQLKASPLSSIFYTNLLQSTYLLILMATQVIGDRTERFRMIVGEYFVQLTLFALLTCTGHFLISNRTRHMSGTFMNGAAIVNMTVFILWTFKDIVKTTYLKIVRKCNMYKIGKIKKWRHHQQQADQEKKKWDD